MAIYKINELLDTLNDYKKQGLEFVNVSEIESIDNDPAALSINGIVDEFEEIDDSIDAVELPEGYVSPLA